MKTNALWSPVMTAPSALEAPADAPLLFRGPVDWIVNAAADAGFEGVELHFRAPEEIDWELLRSSLRARAMKLTGIGTGRIFMTDGLSLSDERREVAAAAEERLRGMMDRAGEHGSAVILGVVRGRLSAQGEAKRGEAYMRLVESYRRLSAYAVKSGCRIVVEGINSKDADSLNITDELLKLLEDVRDPNVLAHLDFCHMDMEGEDLVAAVKKAAGRIGYVHLADTERKAIGKGNIDYKAVLTALKDVGYEGAIGLEYVPAEEGWANAVQPPRKQQMEYAMMGLGYVKALLDGIS